MEQYSPKKILLATDGSEGAGPATRASIDLSKKTGAKLHTAPAWMPHFAHPGLVPLAERVGADLIVVGSRGLGAGRRMLMGSVSTRVLMAAREPVLVCPREKSNE